MKKGLTVLELIVSLTKQDENKPFTATFTEIGDNLPVSIFGDSGEYRELFCSENNDIEPMSIGAAITELNKTEYLEADIILTYGNEDDDIISSMGGVEFKDGELFLNTKTCPQQA